ncbi:unnamed protein product [Ostreobium quekettii]|uniref:AAA+ ATPase domain-containing protein n=1 Tax=Ostreobium quekettii TaxID=121088 RepID=A0A8S1IMG6_9CHLO|nr:unnamed protein product [Ostreobium quekettii]
MALKRHVWYQAHRCGTLGAHGVVRLHSRCAGRAPRRPDCPDADALHLTGKLMAADFSGEAATASDNKVLTESENLRNQCKAAMEVVMEEAHDKARKVSQQGKSTDGEFTERIKGAIGAMQDGLVERDTEVRLLLLAALSGEHVLYIGPPGTAKSELGRRLSFLCKGAFFERLLTRFSVPEELFGPLSMRELEEDRYIRKTEGYLPEATVAFIDEIFKANSAILNTLLTVLNERLFDNGPSRVPVPLVCLVGASNELPESEELNALYDRFLVRREVKQVSAGGLVDLLSTTAMTSNGVYLDEAGQPGNSIDESLTLTTKDFSIAKEKACTVSVPKEVIDLLADLRMWLQDSCEPPIYVSDRRMVKALNMMQVAAFTDGRDSVSQIDCLLLQHVFWNQPEEAEKIYDWLLAELSSGLMFDQIQFVLSGMFGRAVRSLHSKEKTSEVHKEVSELREILTDKLSDVLASVEGGFPEVLNHLWLAEDEAQAVVNALLPKLEKAREALQQTLYETVSLETGLKLDADAVLLATLMPKQWSQFVRKAPSDEVEPIGVTRLRSRKDKP